MKINSNFLIREVARQELSFTQLAARAGLSRVTVYAAKQGKQVQPFVAGRLARALGCDIGDIIACEQGVHYGRAEQ